MKRMEYENIKKRDGKEDDKEKEFKKVDEKVKKGFLKKIGTTLFVTLGIVTAMARCGAKEESPPVYNITPRDVVVSEVGSDSYVDVTDIIKDAKIDGGDAGLEDSVDGTDEVGVDEEAKPQMCNALNAEKQISRTEGEVFIIKTEGGSKYTVEIIAINPEKKGEDANIEQPAFITVWVYDKNGNKKILDDIKEMESKDVVLIENSEDEETKEVKLNITVCKVRKVGDKYYATLETSTGSLEVPEKVDADAGVEFEDDAGVRDDGFADVVNDANFVDSNENTSDVISDAEGEGEVIVDAEGDALSDAGNDISEDADNSDAQVEDTTDVILDAEEDIASDTQVGDTQGQDTCEWKESCSSSQPKSSTLFSVNGEEIKEEVTGEYCDITNEDCSTATVLKTLGLNFSRPLTPNEQNVFTNQLVESSIGVITNLSPANITFGEEVAYNTKFKADDVLEGVRCLTINESNGVTTVWVSYNGRLYQAKSNEDVVKLGDSNLYLKVYSGGNPTEGVPVALLKNVQQLSNDDVAKLNNMEYTVKIKNDEKNGKPNDITGIEFTLKQN
ncbi:MAG: hypothetical protein QXF70_00615 [Candidatus Bilamarchaeaceae archaeon]